MSEGEAVRDGVLSLLAGRRGHFRMESGFHSEWWFNLDSLFAQPEKLQPFVVELARRLSTHRVELVCGPVSGGAKLAAMIADLLAIPHAATERFEDPAATGMFPVTYRLPVEKRTIVRGKVVAIVDDAVSAGSAVRGTLAELVACGASPVAVGALIIFGDAAARFVAERGLALVSLAQMSFGMWKPGECPLCAAGIAVENVSDVA